MPQLGKLVEKIRSKNAGPFWITVDIFCGTDSIFVAVQQKLTAEIVQKLVNMPLVDIKHFEIPALSVIKFSFPRKHIQGSRYDRDMHGAQISTLFNELDI